MFTGRRVAATSPLQTELIALNGADGNSKPVVVSCVKKGEFTLEQAMKGQRGGRSTAVLFL